MRIVGNIIWFAFGGILIFLEYIISGFLLCLTIVGIPFARQHFKLAALALSPFGKRID